MFPGTAHAPTHYLQGPKGQEPEDSLEQFWWQEEAGVHSHSATLHSARCV